MIYVAPNNKDFPPIDEPTKVLYGNNNIVALAEIEVPIISGDRYKWRVDCVEGKTNKRRTGDIWFFTMYDY